MGPLHRRRSAGRHHPVETEAALAVSSGPLRVLPPRPARERASAYIGASLQLLWREVAAAGAPEIVLPWNASPIGCLRSVPRLRRVKKGRFSRSAVNVLQFADGT